MNRLLIFGIVLINFLASCKKETSGEFDFEVVGLESMNVTIGEAKAINLQVVTTNGDPQKVVLSLSDVPDGFVYSFENVDGVPDYYTSLGLSVTKQAKVGTYRMALKAMAGEKVKTIAFDVFVDGSLSMSMTVYDATNWTPELNYGNLVDSAKVKLFLNEAAVLANHPVDSAFTNNDGRAYFYKMQPGNYLFTVEKDGLSNIIDKKVMSGISKGFATTGIFRYSYEINVSAQPNAKIGDLRFRDFTGDWLLTDKDRVAADVLSLYKDVLSEKVVWIGK
ncbi:MAG TPA: hypothetical protein VHO72_02535 [Bacteroidales bacterium]|nr:hypothetical protein [Bacteroidales bacterium]